MYLLMKMQKAVRFVCWKESKNLHSGNFAYDEAGDKR